MTTTLSVRDAVAASLREAPIVGVVRTATIDEAERQARTLIAGGVTLIEITFSVPGATDLVRNLLQTAGLAATTVVAIDQLSGELTITSSVDMEITFERPVSVDRPAGHSVCSSARSPRPRSSAPASSAPTW